MSTLKALAAELAAAGNRCLVVTATKKELRFTSIEVVMGYVLDYLEKAGSKLNHEDWANGKVSSSAGVVECAAFISSPRFDKTVVIISDEQGVIEMWVSNGAAAEQGLTFGQIKKLASRNSTKVELGSTYTVSKASVFKGLRAAGISK